MDTDKLQLVSEGVRNPEYTQDYIDPDVIEIEAKPYKCHCCEEMIMPGDLCTFRWMGTLNLEFEGEGN